MELVEPLLPQIDAATGGVDQDLGFFAADRAIQVFAPATLNRAGMSAKAATLVGLPAIVNVATASAGWEAANDIVPAAPRASWAAKAVRAADQACSKTVAEPAEAAYWSARAARNEACDLAEIDPTTATAESSHGMFAEHWSLAMNLLRDMIAICEP